MRSLALRARSLDVISRPATAFGSDERARIYLTNALAKRCGLARSASMQ